MVDVSIIVPVYQAAPFFEASLSSILAQTHKAIEIILVDDGSTDGSGDLCDAYQEKDIRVRVLHKKNEGVAMARNDGLAAAEGKYIYFCDPDDIIAPKLIEDNFALAESVGADIVVFGYETVTMNANGTLASDRTPYLPNKAGVFSREDYWLDPYDDLSFLTSLCVRFFRRDLIARHHLMMQKLLIGEDEVFLYDVLDAPFNKIAFQQTIYYQYIRHRGSATVSFHYERFDNILAQLERLEKLLLNAPNDARRAKHLKALSIRKFSVLAANTAKAASLSVGEKTALLKEYLRNPRFAKTVSEIKLGELNKRQERIKFLLLKLHLPRLLVLFYAFRLRRLRFTRIHDTIGGA